MKKKLLFLLCLLTILPAAGIKRTFTAATSNVDGLPPVVHIEAIGVIKKDVHMNDDGSQEPGATRMGQLFAENLWDIIALSEDFNYHSYILEGVSTYYNAAKWRGKIEQNNLDGSIAGYLTESVRMNTDGLGFLSRKKYKVTPQPNDEKEGNNWVLWNDHYGYTDNEADGLIRKGFRFYQVTIAEGLVVDVYVTHMEAGSTEGDNAARAKQLIQFANYIKAHKGTNPIIILGDTNCRYTRDPLKEGFIDLIEQDPDLHVQDPWVVIRRNGDYPTPNSPSIMVSQYGEQDGEVVDKIWYINNDKSDCTLTCTGYLHDDSFTYADGSQIADHYPVVGTFDIENTNVEETITEVAIPAAPQKSAVVNNGVYFIRNLGSGEFIRAGGTWTTQAVMGDYPSKFTLTNKGGNKWTLKSTHDNKWLRYDSDGNNYFVDQAENQWTLTQVDKNIYTLADADGNAVGYANGVVAVVSSNTTDPNQQWEFLTQADLINELYYTSSTNRKDVTFLMKAADFGYADQEGWSNVSIGSRATLKKIRPTNDVSFYRGYNIAKGTTGQSSNQKWSFKQQIGGTSDADKLPAGVYEVSYQAFSYNVSAAEHIKINGVIAPYTNIGGEPSPSIYKTTAGVTRENSDNINALDKTVADAFANGSYVQTLTITVTDEGTYANKIVIEIAKPENSSATYAAYDNFKIKCLSVDGFIDMSVYDKVKIAIDDAQAKATESNLKSYRNGQVETLWKEKEIVGDGWAEVKKTYKNLAEAVLQVKDIPADYTYAIVNPSFELYPDYKDVRYNIGGGFPFGWSYPNNYTYDSGVFNATGGDKYTPNPDGEYIFNTWSWGWGGNSVYQEINLTPGLYRLSARITSDEGNKLFLFAGDKNTSIVIPTGQNGNLQDISLNFSVSDGKPLRIGVAGADGADNFTERDGRWYKVDDFHLERIGDAATIKGMEMLQLAINETTDRVKKLNKYDSAWDQKMAPYQAMIDNYTLTGDGKKEFDEVYDLLRAIIYDLPTTNASGQSIEVDYTYAIPNNSFEWGNTYGWDLKSTAGDTGVKPNSDDTYKISQCDGSYLFNTWQDGRGTVISTKINNLPAGHYKLEAMFANDENNYVFLEVQGQEGVASQKQIFQVPSGKGVGEVKTLEFEVADGTPSITILAGGCNNDGTWDDFGGQWYKVDNFKLKRIGEPNICFFYKRLRAAIDEANSVASELPKHYADQWDPSDYQDLIDNHLQDGHDPDAGETSDKYDPLNGGSGITEINELFQRLRDLIFSQKETGADMSGAITNNSFELGDLTGWTTYMDPISDAKVVIGNEGGTYGTDRIDGKYLYNAFYGDRLAHPIYQVIPNVPAGRYTLTVKIASDEGAKFFIGANAKHSEVFTIPASDVENVANEALFHDFSFTFEVPVEAESKNVKIGIYPTSASTETISDKDFEDTAVGPWYKVDHFRLTLDSRYLEVDWEMETDTHGTIMLPFSVSADEVKAKGLEVYTIEKSKASLTPADEDINTYRLLQWIGPHTNGIKANTPYVLKNVGPNTETPAVQRVRAAEGENESETINNNLYRFSGYTSIERDTVTNYLLTGTLIEVPATEDQHHLVQVDDNVGFLLHKDADDNHVAHETVPAYHAYMYHPIKEYRELVTGFYFREPVQYIDWEMETDNYGTLILPFDAALPDDLDAYRLFSVTSENASILDFNAGDGATYQVIDATQVTETMEVTDEEGNTSEKIKLSASTPYLIARKSTPAVLKAARAAADETDETPEVTVDNGVYQFAGVATNTEEEYKLEGLLTGVIVSRDDNMGVGDDGKFTKNSLDEGDRVLVGNAEDGYSFEAVTERTALSRYHAFIDSETQTAPKLLLKAPAEEISIDWSLEAEEYGTIILPFDSEIPEDLEAYELEIPEDEPKTVDDLDGTYVVLTKVDAESLQAHKPYLMVKKAVETEETPETPVNKAKAMKVVAAQDGVYTFTGNRPENDTPINSGALKGTYVTSPVEEGDYIVSNEVNGFSKVTTGEVSGLHAYIKGTNDDNAPDYLLLAEPQSEEDPTTGIDAILAGELGNVDVYNLNGILIRSDVAPAEALRDLNAGVYILRAGGHAVKVLK